MTATLADRFVRTEAIKAAMRGREIEALGKLGINPRGRAHISCPFPDHDDANPSWRWDERTARAHCTCANGHSLSIFDVLGRVEALDFDAAKIRAAELIGRADLIEEKGATTGQTMTASSLLAPPAGKAAPGLPRAYLAHRLGVELDQAPMPTTPAAGWSSLPYWDPPAEKGGKPRLVAEPPCAVFGTIAPDGRAHAHRIYVQPAGIGKAELEGRDPKKSATLAKGTSARGCAVVWGDPEQSPWLLLAEGIETAAAIALAFKAEIEAGQVYVAAAISEAGVGNFEPWPATTKVTVCADRDEAKRKSEPGYKTGEKAAHKLAGRYRDKLDVAIAIPGAPGGKVDFLDVLSRDGAEVVRDAISSAKAHAPEGEEITAPAPVFNPRDPLPIARAFVAAHYQRQGDRTLHHHQGGFYAWTGTHYAELADAELRAALYSMLETAKRIVDDKPVPFQPTSARVSDILDALRAAAHLPAKVAATAWLDGRNGPEPTSLLACGNGLLHLETKRLYSATPRFFGLNALGFDFDPNAPEPEAWTSFLDSLWPDDPESIDTLQEIFGYGLTPDTAQQKIFLIVGPKRSGKGTIGRVLKALLGSANVAAPTLSGLGTNFGPAQLIGKPLAIISDARLSARADQQVIAERLLSISGEDLQTIDRKHREAWTGTLPTRFLVLTNELPRIADASGALASRFIVLTLIESFYGREDHALTERLLAELPGILNWALEGWLRFRGRGRFQQPESSREAIQELEDLGSPIGAFIRDRCTVAPGQTVQPQSLFNAWRAWCEAQGRDHPGSVQTFGRDLRAAMPGLTMSQPREGDGRPRVYEGIGLG